MSEFVALLLYDQRSRSIYADRLAAMLQRANAQLLDVSAGPGAQTIAETFDSLVPRADVILVDVTHPNTNVGIEVGRHMLHRDSRLIPFHCDCEAFSADKIPFYLRGYWCGHLDPTIAVDESPNKELLERIVAVGRQRAMSPLEPYSTGPVDDEEALQVLNRYGTVVKSPGAAFLFGEFAVTVGHPALYLPLPLYVYVGIRELDLHDDTRILYRQQAGTRPEWVELDVEYRPKLREALVAHHI